jgi:hypothetical protein
LRLVAAARMAGGGGDLRATPEATSGAREKGEKEKIARPWPVTGSVVRPSN